MPSQIAPSSGPYVLTHVLCLPLISLILRFVKPALLPRYGDELKVYGNTGSNSTREAVHATRQGFAVGMHAALQINPYYGKTSMTGLQRHFEARTPDVFHFILLHSLRLNKSRKCYWLPCARQSRTTVSMSSHVYFIYT